MMIFLITFTLSFFAGFCLGMNASDRQWRDRAVTGFRKHSGGKLYNVTEDKRP